MDNYLSPFYLRAVSQQKFPKKIASIQYSVASQAEIERRAEVELVNREYYEPGSVNKPTPFGPLDPRMGISTKSSACETCGKRLEDCPGHWGFVRLAVPVFHPGYFKHLQNVLNCICKRCGHVLITSPERDHMLTRIRNPRINATEKMRIHRDIIAACKKQSSCQFCGETNGLCKKVGIYHISHERYKNTKNDETDISRNIVIESNYSEVVARNPEISGQLKKLQELITPIRALELFKKMTLDDITLVSMLTSFATPSDLILKSFPVPPACIRPSVVMDIDGSNEDDLTAKISAIISTNEAIKNDLQKGASSTLLQEHWDLLTAHIVHYFTGENPLANTILPPSVNQGDVTPIRGLITRLKGKDGRFRGNLSGKRVDFSGRTVISPDPNIRLDQVVVPRLMAMTLTFPEHCNQYNRDYLRSLIINGPEKHPGAVSVTLGRTKEKVMLKYANRLDVAKRLQPGDIVERHLVDNDMVLFNRQPSLHRMSIMCHRAKVMENRTLRFNVCCCKPYNADFDGDEMNIHFPQTQEARTEALDLMGINNNLITPKDGSALITATQDFLTGSYVIPRKDVFFDRAEMMFFVAHMLDSDAPVDLPEPAILAPVALWTGKQLYSLLLRNCIDDRVIVNLEGKEKNYGGSGKWMDPRDGYVVFQNSELLAGQPGKTFWGGSKNGLVYWIHRMYSSTEAANRILRLAKLTSRFLMNKGFSIGIIDVTPSENVSSAKASLIDEGYAQCDTNISLYMKNKLQPLPGMTAVDTLEAKLNGDLSRIREESANVCLNELHFSNAPLIMALSGSKGSNINIAQMVACLGQQTVGGSRPANGFPSRYTPFSKFNSKAPADKGFVGNSFYTGLTPIELFAHTAGGREGLVDTAVKTADTGYMQRRLVKAMEDASVAYDYSVRTSKGSIIQFVYGDDCLNPLDMEIDEGPVNFEKTLLHFQNRYSCSVSLLPHEIEEVTKEALDDQPFGFPAMPKERESITNFFNTQAKTASELRKRLGLPIDVQSDSASEAVYSKCFPISAKHIKEFCRLARRKYERSRTDPGHPVGPIGAQSIGEPATQLTLSTFHFAGVGSMNITQGVPRIKEIINAIVNIATPLVITKITDPSSVISARCMKAQIEVTKLGQIAKSVREVYWNRGCHIEIVLDMQRIKALELAVNANTVFEAILNNGLKSVEAGRLKIERTQMTVSNLDVVTIVPPTTELMTTYLHAIADVPVAGIGGVTRVMIAEDKGEHTLLVEGSAIREIMNLNGIDWVNTMPNDVMRIYELFGIEAARQVIINEITGVMSSHGMDIDPRHIALLADSMTVKGQVHGITRHGIAGMNESTLMLASFEQTGDHLHNAAYAGRKDEISNTSECVITGVPLGKGTGCMSLYRSMDYKSKSSLRPKTLDIYSKFLENPDGDYWYNFNFLRTIKRNVGRKNRRGFNGRK